VDTKCSLQSAAWVHAVDRLLVKLFSCLYLLVRPSEYLYAWATPAKTGGRQASGTDLNGLGREPLQFPAHTTPMNDIGIAVDSALCNLGISAVFMEACWYAMAAVHDFLQALKTAFAQRSNLV
jgi:hypothetical protein